MFGKRKVQELGPPVPAVDWRDVRRFTIGRTERSVVHGKKPQLGRLAVRVPRKTKDASTYAPCAYFRTDSPSNPVSDPVLYEDETAHRVLCALDDPVNVGKEVHRTVRDGAGQAIGVLRRIAASNKFAHHSWRIDQPDRPEIAGLSQWSFANNSPKELAMRGLESTFTFLLEATADPNPPAAKGRKLEWKAEGQLVMESKGISQFDSSLDISIKVGWLDRRLAFAFAMVEDFPL
ncbi:hypothetical protein ACWC24_11725 [Streptomyces sp. NPDC001443]